MQKPLDQQAGRLLGVVGGTAQNLYPKILEAATQGGYRRHGRAFGVLAQKRAQFGLQYRPSRTGDRLPFLLATQGEPFQIVEIVEEDVVELGHVRRDIAGNRRVDEKDRPPPARLQGRSHVTAVQHILAAAERRDHDVRARQGRRQLCPVAAMAADALRRPLGTPFDRVSHCQFGQAGQLQFLRQQFAHFPEPEKQRPAASEIAVDLPGDLQGRRSQRHGPLADIRFAADTLGRGVGRLQRLLQDTAHLTDRGGPLVGRLDLAEDLRFADDLAV